MKTAIATGLIFLTSTVISSLACTTIVVGNKATSDGSIIVARNNDLEDACTSNILYSHPEQTDSFQLKSNQNNFTFTLPGYLAYTAMPETITLDKHNASMEETGINQHGVVISATETIFNSEQVLKVDPYLPDGITEDMITSVVLPQAISAKDGVKILGGIVEKMGAGEGFGVAFCDQNEAWYLESASGHQWLAMRIPDDKYFVSANQGRFQKCDLSDNDNVLSSPELVKFAKENKLFDPEKEEFNFLKCYIKNTDKDITYNYPRIRTLLKKYSDFNYKKIDHFYPVFMKPKKKMTVWDVAAGLRNHYDETVNDPYQAKNPDEPNRPISVLRASFSHITQTRPNLPDDISVVQYIALGMSDLSAYLPFYKGLLRIPMEYNDDSMFWKYRKMQALVFQDYPRFAPAVHDAIVIFERDIAIKQNKMEKDYQELYQTDLGQAREIIQRFIDDIIAEENKMLSNLTAKISKDLGMENLINEQYTEMIQKAEALYHFPGA